MPKVTPAYHALSEQLPILPYLAFLLLRSSFYTPLSRFILSLSRRFSLSLTLSWIAHILPSLPPPSLPPSLPPPFFPFTFRRRLTVVSCFLYRLAPPLLRAIQPTLYEKTLKSFFATGRASWLLLPKKPGTAATRLGNSGEGGGEGRGKMHQFMRITRERENCEITRFPSNFPS